MAISRTKKEAVVEKLKSIFSDAQTIVFVQFDTVTAEEANDLRSACADEGVGYVVAKKTLMKRAFADSLLEGDFPAMEGEIALAYGADILAPARVIGEWGKKTEGRVRIVGGVFERALVEQDQMQVIADIPPVETLYAQFLVVIRSPIQGLASVLSQIAGGKN